MSEKNTVNLRYDNSFTTKVYKDLYWVPVRELGDSRYATKEMEEKKNFLPEEKYRLINTLYEAVQMFQVSDFKNMDDINRVTDNENIWEIYKTGYESVLTNEGCCASCVNWLIYMLKGKYNKIGALCYIRPWATGHCVNYIYHNNWYYLIDMQIQEKGYVNKIAKETGDLNEYLKSKPFANVFFKTRQLETYIEYISKYQKLYGDRMFFLKQETEILPISIKTQENEIKIFLPKNKGIEVCTPNKCPDKFKYKFVDLPDQITYP